MPRVTPSDVEWSPKGAVVIFLKFSGRVGAREYWRFARFPLLFLPITGVVVYGVVTVGVLRRSSLGC